MNKTVYAIRHKPTGEWMPARLKLKSKGGWSSWVPGPDTTSGWNSSRGILDEPRIFYSMQSARNALSMWLVGVWRIEFVSNVDWESGNDEGGAQIIPEAAPVPRVREDMEIVPLQLVAVS